MLVVERYTGFVFELASQAFTSQINKAFDEVATIDAELNRIEKKFLLHYMNDYLNFLYPYKIEDLNHWQSALFNAFFNGYEFDYSKKELSLHEMKALIHVEQIFEYYKYVHTLKQTTGKTTIESQHTKKNGKGNQQPIDISKLDFTKDKLKPIVLEFAHLNGYENPSTYLNELLNKVNQFNDYEFRCNFILNLRYLCKENSTEFWSESHRKNISEWLEKNATFVTDEDFFKNMWEPLSTNHSQYDTSSKLTFLLEKYYLNDCKPLNKQQVEKIAQEKGASASVYVNKWKMLKRDGYRHNGNSNNIKSFIAAYEFLIKQFANNSKALKNVKNHYDPLKETYSDIST